jgi:hypothetical protein
VISLTQVAGAKKIARLKGGCRHDCLPHDTAC